MLGKKSLGVKIGAAFGVVILIAAALGFIGWRGVNQVRGFMTEYALWGDIDMVMNEGVTQKVLMLSDRLNIYRYEPGPENLEQLEAALAAAEEGVTEWAGLVRGYPDLETVARHTAALLADTRGTVKAFTASMAATSEIRKKWDGIVAACLDHLVTTMEEVIDPAKAAAEAARDVEAMVRWGAIDMVMNEAVIANVLRLQTRAHDYAAEKTGEHWDAFQKTMGDSRAGLAEWRETFGGDSAMAAASDKVTAYLDEYDVLGGQYHAEVLKFQALETETTAAFANLFAALDTAMETVIDPAKAARVDAAGAAQKRAALLAVSVTVAGVVIGILLAVVTVTGITRPLNRVVAELNIGSNQVETASGQVTSSSHILAEGASEQAASIEETSASLEELSAMTKKNAENAAEADALMKEADMVVAQANQTMEDLTISMAEISKASEETQKIVKTIDEIAFQTNLLALNAAVEAARAGEAGAGFAVVADEVRNLAMRAAGAAKNTAGLIDSTTQKIGWGVELVEQTNEAFGDVARNSARVGGLVEEIAAASGEQATGIEQINRAISEMERVVQQTAASAEESAAASEEMGAQCGATFRIVQEMKSLIHGENRAEKQLLGGELADPVPAVFRGSLLEAPAPVDVHLGKTV